MNLELIYLTNQKKMDFVFFGQTPNSIDTFQYSEQAISQKNQLEINDSGNYIFFIDLKILDNNAIKYLNLNLKYKNISNIYLCVIHEVSFNDLEEVSEKFQLLDQLPEIIPNLNIYLSINYTFKNLYARAPSDFLLLWDKAFKHIPTGNLQVSTKSDMTTLSNSSNITPSLKNSSNRFNNPLGISSAYSDNDTISPASESSYYPRYKSSYYLKSSLEYQSLTRSYIDSINWSKRVNKYIQPFPEARCYVNYMTEKYKHKMV